MEGLQEYRLATRVFARRATRPMSIKTPMGYMVVNPGDYIVKTPGGAVWKESAEDFEVKYEPLFPVGNGRSIVVEPGNVVHVHNYSENQTIHFHEAREDEGEEEEYEDDDS